MASATEAIVAIIWVIVMVVAGGGCSSVAGGELKVKICRARGSVGAWGKPIFCEIFGAVWVSCETAKFARNLGFGEIWVRFGGF